jgi:hypothetical protein
MVSLKILCWQSLEFLLSDERCLQFDMTIALFIRHNTEGAFLSVVGERFNWGIAGQAFLVGAAVTLTQTVQANHYPSLLIIVPFLGLILAGFSILQTLEVIWRNNILRLPIREMHAAKLTAFRLSMFMSHIFFMLPTFYQFTHICFFLPVLGVGKWHALFFPPLHYLLLLVYWWWYWTMKCCSYLIQQQNRFGFQKRQESIDTKMLWLTTYGQTRMLGAITWLIEILVLLVAASFFVAWLILLANESNSRREGCSNWWHNTCQGSDVICNEQEALNECLVYS